jgi:hypothetical protein
VRQAPPIQDNPVFSESLETATLDFDDVFVEFSIDVIEFRLFLTRRDEFDPSDLIWASNSSVPPSVVTCTCCESCTDYDGGGASGCGT